MNRTSLPKIIKVYEEDGINKEAVKESNFFLGNIIVNTAVGADKYAYWIDPNGERLCYLTKSQLSQLQRIGVEELDRPTNHELSELVRIFNKVAPHHDIFDWFNKKVDTVRKELEGGETREEFKEEEEEDYYFDIETTVFSNTYFIKGTSRNGKHTIALNVQLTLDRSHINRVEVLYGNQMFDSPFSRDAQAETIRFPLYAVINRLTKLRDKNPGTMGIGILSSFFDAVEEELDEDNDNEIPIVACRIGSEVRIDIDCV